MMKPGKSSFFVLDFSVDVLQASLADFPIDFLAAVFAVFPYLGVKSA